MSIIISSLRVINVKEPCQPLRTTHMRNYDYYYFPLNVSSICNVVIKKNDE